MSQVKQKDVELTGLKQHNKNLEEINLKREQEKKKVEEKCQELINQNTKLTKQVVGQMDLQGAVDVFVTSECIHLYILCIVPRCLFR